MEKLKAAYLALVKQKVPAAKPSPPEDLNEYCDSCGGALPHAPGKPHADDDADEVTSPGHDPDAEEKKALFARAVTEKGKASS